MRVTHADRGGRGLPEGVFIMSFISVRSRLLVVAITGLASILCALGVASGALAEPGAVLGLASASHSNEATWYSNPDPSFTWSPLAGVVGYSYALDHSLVSDPATAPVSMPAVAFAPRADVSAGARPWGVTVADFNADGKDDLASANWLDETASVMLGHGDGTFSAPLSYDVGVTPHSVAAGHIDGNASLGLVVTSSDSGQVWVLLGHGDGTFAVPYPRVGTGSGAKQVVAANFDTSTAWDEVVFASASENGVRLYHSDSAGDLDPSLSSHFFAAGSKPEALAVGTFDGGSDLDLAVTNWDAATVSILLGDGAGGFAAPVAYATGSNPHSVTARDFNTDGNTDLAVANYTGNTVSVLLGNGDGTFQPKVDFGASLFSVPSAVTAGDFNGDTHLDLAVADWSLDDVEVLLGDGAGNFDATHAASFALGDQPNALATGDFNNDGSPDLVAAQSGGDGGISGPPGDTLGVLLNATRIPPRADFTGIADGVWYFHVRAVDSSDSGGPTSTRAVRIDTTAPGAISGLGRSTHGTAANWYSNNTPALSWSAATDASSGVAGYSYILDQVPGTTPDLASEGAGLSKTYTTPVADGVWYFHVRALDNAGIGGVTSHYTVNLDTTAPVTRDNAPARSTATSVTVTLIPTDAASGMTGGSAGTWYKLDGAASYASGASIVVSGVGQHTLTYYSSDAAGNAETPLSTSLTLVGTPTLTTPKSPTTVKRHKAFTVWGVLKPHFAAGAKTVRVKAYVKRSGKWVTYKSYSAVNADYRGTTKYSRRISLPKRGKYRFMASTSASAIWLAASTGPGKTVTVK